MPSAGLCLRPERSADGLRAFRLPGHYDPATGRFTAPDPIGYTGGDYDLWDYCVDDPVSKNDPSGLFLQGAFARFAAKQVGKAIGKSFFNKTANADEEMADVRNRINDIEEKIRSGKVTEDELENLEKDRKRENELWNEYGEIYLEKKSLSFIEIIFLMMTTPVESGKKIRNRD